MRPYLVQECSNNKHSIQEIKLPLHIQLQNDGRQTHKLASIHAELTFQTQQQRNLEILVQCCTCAVFQIQKLTGCYEPPQKPWILEIINVMSQIAVDEYRNFSQHSHKQINFMFLGQVRGSERVSIGRQRNESH